MWDSGSRTSSMAKALRAGPMAQFTTENTPMERRMAGESWSLLTVRSTRASLKKTRFTGKASICGRMASVTREIGFTIKWTEVARSTGPTVRFTQASSRTTSGTARVNLRGRTAVYTMASGATGSNMGKPCTRRSVVSLERASGLRASAPTGSTETHS